jgi:ABC-type sugar transport system permease subunit
MEPGSSRKIDPATKIILRVTMTWHVVLLLAGVIGLAITLSGGIKLEGWLRAVVAVIVTLFAAGNGAALVTLARLKHRGRVLSLLISYLAFLFCFLGMLNLLGVFTGIDALAGTFGRGLPFLGVVFTGYLIGAAGDRSENRTPRHRMWFSRTAKAVMAVGFISFLLAVGLLPGSLALLKGFGNLLTLGLGVGAAASAVMLWMMWRAPTAQALGATIRDSEMLDGLMFLSPNLLGFLLFFAGPLLFSLYVSFTNWDAFGAKQWVGLHNYAVMFHIAVAPLSSANQPFSAAMDVTVFDELFRLNMFGQNWVVGAEDRLFWISIGNTLMFGLMSVPLSVAPALLVANMLNTRLRGMTFFRAVYFLPSIAAVVGVALIWRWLYNSTVGWINYLISTGLAGVGALLHTSIADPKIGWLSDANVALLAVVIVAAWQWVGFNTVLFLAGLQSIPGDLYEAAIVDGAGVWDKFWKITVPMLAPTTFFVISTTTINATQLFDQVFVLTNPPGGPGTSTLTTVLYLYQNGFQNFRQGYASAIAWMLFLLILGLTLIQFQRQRGTMAYDG